MIFKKKKIEKYLIVSGGGNGILSNDDYIWKLSIILKPSHLWEKVGCTHYLLAVLWMSKNTL